MLKHSDDYNRALLAEVYDQTITGTEDVQLLLSLIHDEGQLQVLECFSGTGRIALPLLQRGHLVTAIELAPAMAERALAKAEQLGPEVVGRFTQRIQDALKDPWGTGEYDVVVIGCNALYELSTAQTQQLCVSRAFAALRKGGRLFIDNSNWQTPLESEVGRKWVGITGTGADGTYLRHSAETVAVEVDKGLLHIKRTWYTRTAAGLEHTEEYMGCKRPVNGAEVGRWLREAGFTILKAFGDTRGSPFQPDSPRAIWWAAKQ